MYLKAVDEIYFLSCQMIGKKDKSGFFYRVSLFDGMHPSTYFADKELFDKVEDFEQFTPVNALFDLQQRQGGNVVSLVSLEVDHG